MDSLIGYDKTLPIDLDGSTNPDLLTEVTFGGHLEYPDGSIPMVAKTNTGRMSPVRGRTMREYDQLIGELKKENFDLKLRIYYMEERMQQKHGKEDEFKINVGLKVELQRHKAELEEKRNLLKEASDTINKMSENFSAEVEASVNKYKEEFDFKLEEERQNAESFEEGIHEARIKLEELGEQCKQLEDGLKDTEQDRDQLKEQVEGLKETLADKDQKLEEQEGAIMSTERQLKEMQVAAEKVEDQLRDELEKQMTNVGRRDRDIKRLSIIVKEKTQIDGLSLLESSHLQDEVENQRRSLEKLHRRTQTQEAEAQSKDGMIAKMEDLLRQKDKELKGLSDDKHDQEKNFFNTNTKYKKLVFEFTNSAMENAREIEELSASVDELQGELNKTRSALQHANMQRHKEVEGLTAEKSDLAAHSEVLVSRLNDQEKKLENLLELLGNKDGELDRFRNLLRTAEMSLDKSEKAVEKLREQFNKDQAVRYSVETRDFGVQVDDHTGMMAAKELENKLLQKLGDLNNLSHKVDLSVTQQDGTSDNTLQQILQELQNLGKSVQGDRNIRIEVNSRSPERGQSETVPVVHRSPPAGSHAALSRIPVRKTSSTSVHPDDLDTLRKQLTEFQARNKDLENTLRATEETVRQQTQKMKHYKNMLMDRGMLPRSLTRCTSDPNLTNMCAGRHFMSQEKFSSTDNLFGGRRSLSPTPTGKMMGHNLSGEGVVRVSENGQQHAVGSQLSDSLKRENAKLKEQLEGYRRMLKVFQGRSPSPPTSNDSGIASKQDIGVQSNMPIDQVDDWLNSLEQLLQELRQGDQDACSSPSGHISRIQRGLGDARQAIRSLSSSANQVGAVSSTQRSPDGGLFPIHRVSPASSRGSKLIGQSPVSSLTSPESQYGMVSGTSYDSVERLRCRIASGQTIDHNPSLLKDFSVCDSVFPNSTCDNNGTVHDGNGTVHDGNGAVHDGNGSLCRDRQLSFQFVPPKSVASMRTASQLHDMTAFCDKTFMPGSLENMSEVTLNDTANMSNFAHSRFLDLEDMSVDLDCDSGTSLSLGPSLEMDKLRHRVEVLESLNETLKKDLQFYHNMIGSEEGEEGEGTSKFNGVLLQHLRELQTLRKKLENKMQDSDELERALKDALNRPTGPDPAVLSHEATIRDLQQLVLNLRHQMSDCQNNIHQKVNIIEEQERIIEDLNIRLVKQRDQSAKDVSDVENYKESVKAMEAQIKQCQEKEDKFTQLVKQLKDALEQYKRRVLHLEGDIKQHREVSVKSQRRAHELEEELRRSREELQNQKEEFAHKVKEISEMRLKIVKLESENEQCRDSERSCRGELGQTRVKITELTETVTTLKERIKCQTENVNRLRAELDESAKRQEEHMHKIHESVGLIEQQKRHLDERNQAIKRMEAAAREKNQQLEGQAAINSQITLRLEQERKLMIEQKQRLEKQGEIIRDFERRLEHYCSVEMDQEQANQDLEKKMKQKDGEVRLAMEKKEKYLSNLKKALKELKKTQIELKSLRKDLKERSDLNRTLKLELSVHEKLSTQESFSQSDQRNIILQLLNEIKVIRTQMEEIMEQNTELRRNMEQMLVNLRKDSSPPRSQGTDATDGHPSPGRPRNFEGSRLSGLDRFDEESLMSKFSVHLELHQDLLQSPDTTTSSDSGNIEGADQTGSGYGLINKSAGNITWPGTLELSSSSQTYGSRLSESLPIVPLPSAASGGHFSIPGPLYSQRVTDKSLTYQVDDSHKYLAGLTQVRIDSDQRTLFAVGKIDDFEKVRKELGEALITVKGMSARITSRLQYFNHQPASEIIKSMEYSTLKELSLSTENLRICLDEENSLIGCFWFSELPAPNERGEFVNQKLQHELQTLRQSVLTQRGKYEYMCKMVDEANQRLDVANLKKVNYEQELCDTLECTTDVISLAKHNLQSKWDQRTLKPDGASDSLNLSSN